MRASLALAVCAACHSTKTAPPTMQPESQCHAPAAQAPVCASGQTRALPWTLLSQDSAYANAAAIADVDGDGRLDVVFGGFAVTVYRAAADGTYTAGWSSPTNAQVSAVAVADLDRDGKLDVVAGMAYPGSFAVLHGNGDGTFQRADLTTSDEPLAIAFADVDGDGNLDLVASARPPGDDCHFDVVVRLGHGDGTFGNEVVSRPASGACGGNKGKLELADLDGDGKLDIVGALVGVQWLHGYGDGTFGEPALIDYQATGFELATFDGDALPDLALDTGMLHGNGDGTFTRTSTALAPGGGFPVLASDIDGDHVLDLGVVLDTFVTVANAGGQVTFREYAISVLHGNGDGTFQLGPQQQLEAPVFATAFTDLDGDHTTDVLVATAAGIGPLQVSNHAFEVAHYPATYADNGSLTPAVVVADLDGDQRPDVAIAEAPDSAVSVYHTMPDGTLGPRTDYPTHGEPAGLVAADLEGDGITDLVYVTPGDFGAVLTELQGFGDGTFLPATTIATPVSVTSIYNIEFPLAIGDLNGDGIADIATPGTLSTIAVAHGKGDGTFGPVLEYPAGQGASQVVIADVNGDGFADLVTLASSLTVLLGTPDGTFGDFIEYPANVKSAAGLVIGDVNGDGNPDAVVADGGNMPGTQAVSVLLGNCDGTFQLAATYPTTIYPRSPRLGDVNGDGRVDIILGSPVGVMYGNGDGTFGPLAFYGFDSGALDVGDLNGDGMTDLVWPGAPVDVDVLLSGCR